MMRLGKFKQSNHSLKFKLNLSILTFVCVAFFSLAVFISKYSAPILKSQLEDNAQKSVATYVSDFSALTMYAEQVILNTKNTLNHTTEDNVEAIKVLLNSALKTVSYVDLDFANAWLYVFQPENVSVGELYISSIAKDDAINFKIEHINNLYDKFPWFKQVPKQETIYWSEPYVDDETGKSVFTCLIPFKFANQQDFNGLLALTIDLSNIQKNISEFSFYETGKLILLSKSGLYVTYPDPDVALKSTIFDLSDKLNVPQLKYIGKELAAGRGGQIVIDDIPAFDGSSGVFFYAPIKHLGWSFCLVYNEHEFLKPIKHFQIMTFIALLVSVALLMLIINWICHYSTKQLLTLSHIAAQYGGGNFAHNFDFEPTSSEIGTLADALSKMRINLLNYIEQERHSASEKQKHQSELEIARHIQKSALSTVYPKNEAFAIATTMIPAQRVGGDFYDFFFIDENKFAIVVADVSGKGIPAALYMMKALTLIRNISRSKMNLDFVFSEVNKQLEEGNDTCMFVTAFMAVIDLRSGETTYVNAGHNPPLIGKNKTFNFLQTKKNIILGINPQAKYVAETIKLQSGTHLFLYTDGVTEAENDKAKFYGEDRLLKIFQKAHDAPQENVDMLLADIKKFVKNNPQSDDITMLDFVYLGQSKFPLQVRADITKLQEVLQLLQNDMLQYNVSAQGQFDMVVAAEEIFSNIASYAYDNEEGMVEIKTSCANNIYSVSFKDQGKKYNPLKRQDPDTTSEIKEREIGGLGVFLAKKVSDTISYEYKDGCNILSIGINVDK